MIRAHARALAFLDRIRNPQAQLAIIVGMIFYFIGLISWQHKTPQYADKIQPVLEVQSNIRQLASKVTVGLHLNNFAEFSFSKNKFKLDALVWFTFPIGTESLYTIEKFSFQNGTILQKSPPMIKIIGKSVMISFQTIVEFKAHLDYSYFPLTGHRLSIVLENRSVTPNELCFDSSVDSFALSDELLTNTWVPRRKIVKAGYIKSLLHEKNTSLQVSYPCVAYTLEFTNDSIRDIISLYFPLFILFFIGFFSLLIDIRKDALRTTVLATAMPTLGLFRLVIDKVAPPASNITRVDYMYYLLICLALFLLLFQVYVLLVLRRIIRLDNARQDAKIIFLEFLNSGVFAITVAILVCTITYIHW